MTTAIGFKPGRHKLSHEIARRIARDIIDDRLCEGEVIGRESGLLSHYGISRDTFREAVRVLEWQGLVRTTRGPGGGLLVAKPSQDAIINILRDYFDLTDTLLEEVLEVRHRLHRMIAQLATIRLSSAGARHLQTLRREYMHSTGDFVRDVRAHLTLIDEVGKISGNPLLTLFNAPLDFVTVDSADLEVLSTALLEESQSKGREILLALVQSIIDNEERGALRQVDAYMELTRDRLLNPSQSQGRNPTAYPHWFDSAHSKTGQGLVYRIKRDIQASGIEVGERLGSELELIDRYEVSRSIFREASRILELIGITETRKGRNGGLMLGTADPGNTIEAVAHFLEQVDLPFDQVYEVRVALDAFAVELAASRRTNAQLSDLEKALEAESKAETSQEFFLAAAELHSAICRASGNRVVSLFIDILINSRIFQPTHQQQLQQLIDNKTLLVRSHERIIRDIRNQDAASAVDNMRDHRAQVSRYLRM